MRLIVPTGWQLCTSGRSLGHANQNSDTVVQFKVDQSTGTLTPTGQPIQIPKPVCVLFVKV
jgi:6-phosphogluconolactonase